MNWYHLDEKISSMSAHDIIMAMVNGLRKPITAIDMDTIVEQDFDEEEFWRGGAFINTILPMLGYTRSPEDEPFVDDICLSVDNAKYFFQTCTYGVNAVLSFQMAIYFLSKGFVEGYNKWASPYFAQITPIPGQKLPRLENDYTEEELQEYVKLAEYQLPQKPNK